LVELSPRSVGRNVFGIAVLEAAQIALMNDPHGALPAVHGPARRWFPQSSPNGYRASTARAAA